MGSFPLQAALAVIVPLALVQGDYVSVDAPGYREMQCYHRECARDTPYGCGREVDCDPYYPYRTIDGTCNNLKNPLWGSADYKYQRVIKPSYEDGKGEPRGGLRDSRLPSPRLLCSILATDKDVYSKRVNSFAVSHAQMIDHDMALASTQRLACCTTERNNPECIPIEVPKRDPFYGKHNVTCLSMARTLPYCNTGKYGEREQINEVTSFLDGSTFYGNDDKTAYVLRELKCGRLLARQGYPHFLPTENDIWARHPEYRNETENIKGDMIAGDTRVKQSPALTAQQIVWFNYHNHLANEICEKRPCWTDERIYQVAREINIALLQHVTYNELIPVYVGPEAAEEFDLESSKYYRYTKYDPNRNPSTVHPWSSAAFRCHTMVNGKYDLRKEGKVYSSFDLQNYFNDGKIVQSNDNTGWQDLCEGMTYSRAMEFDRWVTSSLTNMLFMDKEKGFGQDLCSRNIQRGRDHGISSYNAYRVFCGYEPLTDWEHRPYQISKEDWNLLRKTYQKPQDIDLYVGGIHEIPVEGGVLGPVFACLNGHHFKYIKEGDRFFYTHKDQVGSLTPRQLETIWAHKMSDILCEISDIKAVPKYAFLVPSKYNPLELCKDPNRHDLDIEAFLEKKGNY